MNARAGDHRTPDQRRFGGWLLIAVGGLMTVLCGSCTAVFWAGPLSSGHTGWLDTNVTRIVFGLISLFVGVLPTLAGVYLVWSGMRDLGIVEGTPKPRE